MARRSLCIMMNLPQHKWALNSAVECHLHTVEVIGSNPIAPTNSSSFLFSLLRGSSGSVEGMIGHAPSPRFSLEHGVVRGDCLMDCCGDLWLPQPAGESVLQFLTVIASESTAFFPVIPSSPARTPR